MSTDLVPFSKFAVSNVEMPDLLETIKENVGGQTLTENDLDTVKMPSGGSVTWEVPTVEGVNSQKDITGVIIFSKNVRAYWETSYDDGGGNDRPDCASRDAEQAFPVEGFEPPAQQHPSGGFACATCTLSKFGSAMNKDGSPSRGQACQQRRLVFMLTQNDVLPFVVTLSPTSLKAAGDYFLRLTRGNIPYWKVVTKITLDRHDNPKPHARAVFEKVGDLDGGDVARLTAYRDALVPAFRSMADFEPASSGS